MAKDIAIVIRRGLYVLCTYGKIPYDSHKEGYLYL